MVDAVQRGVERWLGEKKNPEDGGGEEDGAQRPLQRERRLGRRGAGARVWREMGVRDILPVHARVESRGSLQGKSYCGDACFTFTIIPNPWLAPGV